METEHRGERGRTATLGLLSALVAFMVPTAVPSPAVALSDPAQTNTWTSHGPSSGLEVTSLVIDPSTADTVYAATTSTQTRSRWGVVKSIDGGESWTLADAGITPTCPPGGTDPCDWRHDVLSLAIDPSHPATLYAGTSTSVFKTIDGGSSWTDVGGPNWAHLAIDPSHPDTVYAGSEDYGGSDGGRVFKTIDGGATWTESDAGIQAVFVSSLVVDPTRPDTVYAGTNYSGGGSIFKTTDGGVTWTKVSAGLPASATWPALAIDPSRPDTVLACGQALARSTDGGATWTTVAAVAGGCAALAIDPSQPQTVYAAGYPSVFRSEDSGETWTALSGFPVSGIGASARTLAARGSRIYAGKCCSQGGVFASADAGSTWRNAIDGFEPDTAVVALGMAPSNPDRIYAATNGTTGHATYMTDDGGSTWRGNADAGLPAGAPITSLAVVPSQPSTVYAGMLAANGAPASWGVYKTTNGGETWSRAGPLIDVYDTAFALGIYSVAIDPIDPNLVYAGGFGSVFKSIDAGSTWIQVPVGLPVRDQIETLAIDPSSPLTIYAGTDSGVFKSVTGGLGWAPTSAVVGVTGPDTLRPRRPVLALAIAPSDPATLFAGVCCGPVASGGVLKTTDGGITWSLAGLAPRAVRSVAIDPSDPDTVYVGSDTGIFVTEDGGASWNAMNDGLPVCQYSSIDALLVDPTGTRVYTVSSPLCALGGGVYELRRTSATPAS